MERAGIPEASEPDSYLLARLDKFYAELQVRPSPLKEPDRPSGMQPVGYSGDHRSNKKQKNEAFFQAALGCDFCNPMPDTVGGGTN